MLFVIRCTDVAGGAACRRANRDAHLAYLREYMDAIHAAGPLLDDDGDDPVGSLLIMDFPDRRAAETFAANDPYAKAGLFAHVEITPWRHVLP